MSEIQPAPEGAHGHEPGAGNAGGDSHRFRAEPNRPPRRTALLVATAFVVVMAVVGAGVWIGKGWIRDFSKQREEARREKERLAKVEQQRAKKVFAPPGTLPPSPPPETKALPTAFGGQPGGQDGQARPIELREPGGQAPGAHRQGASSGQGTNNRPPAPQATMMLDPEASVRAGGRTPPSAPEPADRRDPAAEYQAKVAALQASAEASQKASASNAAPGVQAAGGTPAQPGVAGAPVILRGVGRSTVQDYAKVSAARSPITTTPQATAARLGDRALLLARGAFIPCVLETQLLSNVPGSARCIVPEDIYSDDGATVLIEKASTFSGTYGGTLRNGDSRIAVVWSRLKSTDGVVIDVDSPAADGVGTMGVDGYVDNHWGQRIGAALLLSLIDDVVAIEVAKQSEGSTSVRPSSTTDTTKSMSEKVLESTINIAPTIAKNRGSRLMIYVQRDLWFHDVYSIAKR